jgi:hypothetical protein
MLNMLEIPSVLAHRISSMSPNKNTRARYVKNLDLNEFKNNTGNKKPRYIIGFDLIKRKFPQII